MLLVKIRKTVRRYGLLTPGDRVVVAVSGGPDSVCLLQVLRALAPEYGLTLHAAHIDHLFRGEESAGEARFVRELADKLGLPVTVERFDVPAYCRERGLPAQAGAREVRYGFLNRVADSVGAEKIALGHTASDQAETVIMRLLRGAGLPGLSGMPPMRDAVIRPLIEVMREDVMDYLRSAGLPFMTDSSNLKPVYTRNRIRLELMPALKAFNPRIEETLSAEANLLRDEDEVMEARLADLAPDILRREGDLLAIVRTSFLALPAALRRRLLRKAVQSVLEAGAAELSAAQTEEANEFMVNAQTGRCLNLPEGLTLEREYDTFFLRPRSEPDEFMVRLALPGATIVPGLLIEVNAEIRAAGDADVGGNYLWQAAFDYDKIGPLLYIRKRRNGDRFCPAGMEGRSKKLQDFFTDEKVPKRMRDTVPILATEQDVVWVVGMRTDERFLPGPQTTRELAVSVRNKGNTVRHEE